MKIRKRLFQIFLLAFFLGGWGKTPLWPSFAQGSDLLFSKRKFLVNLPWSNGSNDGVSSAGPEWLIVDNQGRFYLESNMDFDIYSSGGKHIQRIMPFEKAKNYYGFAVMEALPSGGAALLIRLESSQEQWAKDEFEENSKPGVRLIVLKADGKIQLDKELVDPSQPHSNYYIENGVVYSVHEDGTYQILDSFESRTTKDPNFRNFAAIAYNPERWLEHIKKLPVFQSGDKTYHDVEGKLHFIKGTASSLMNRPFVEGLGPLAERNGRFYYSVVCDINQDFINEIFVEDFKKRDYGLVDLIHSNQDLHMVHGHTVFVDRKGNIFEGVGKKDGYRIYEWQLLGKK